MNLLNFKIYVQKNKKVSIRKQKKKKTQPLYSITIKMNQIKIKNVKLKTIIITTHFKQKTIPH